MDDAARAQLKSRVKTGVMLAGAAVAVGLLVGGAFILLLHDWSPETTSAPVKPLDVSDYPAPSDGASAASAAPASSLSMVGKIDAGGAPGAGAAAAAPRTPLDQAATGFRDAIRGSEKMLGDLARDYTRRYPIVQQYGRDWMSYTDLKKLNDDYMRDHDPIAFLRGLSVSPSFPKLLQKYAGQPAIQSFVRESVTKAPAGAVTASMDYLTKDKTLDTFVQNVGASAGLPPGMLNPAMPADGSALDVNKLAEQAMKSAQLRNGAPGGAAAPQDGGDRR